MIPRPVILPPASPSELLTYVISHCRHPTTVIVCTSRQDFVAALTKNALPPIDPAAAGDDVPQAGATQPPFKNPLLQQTLLQIAVSRHIRIVFLSSVAHFRAWTAVFSPSDSKLPHPPAPQSPDSPVVLVYGLVGLHRDTSEWSAQGISASAVSIVDAAARHGFRAALVEAREDETECQQVDVEERAPLFEYEKLPLLKGIGMREDGSWAGRTVELRTVLGRWFVFKPQDET
ncbi:hypothetical protein NLU13_0873 [Sarocladium strictum]|uniref:Uncharacterized protein n=1 Tax=Sarocladium strictum TaxID=5046 RepID=A0AA39GPV6_SARSR|nr:hypothetical protein NLU13_0873 [Sarocladium strictum]